MLAALFGSRDYVCGSASSCGDYNVPGSVAYQNLHAGTCDRTLLGVRNRLFKEVACLC